MRCLIKLAIPLLLCLSCNRKNESNIMESPLATVVKLETAESYKDYELAKKYIDVEKVYFDIAQKESKEPENIWKEMVEFNYSVGNSSNKFINSFPFHKYKIEEVINESVSKVTLTNTENTQNIKQIIYSLAIQNNKWKIISIEFKK